MRKLSSLVLFLAVVLLPFVGASQALAMHDVIVQEQTDIYCAPKDDFETILAEGYGEKPVRQSFQDVGNGALFIWWESTEEDPSLRTWSLTMTFPDGKTCLYAAGKMNWQPVTPKNTDPSY